MINNRKLFESWKAFWIFLGIMIILFVVSFFCNFEKNRMSNGVVSQSRIIDEISGGRDEEWVPGPGDEGYYDNNYDNNYDNVHDGTVGYSYVIIAEEGIINVYSISPDGMRTLFYRTEIPYELLSESDKIMLRKGMTLNSMDELNNILQDFDS